MFSNKLRKKMFFFQTKKMFVFVSGDSSVKIIMVGTLLNCLLVTAESKTIRGRAYGDESER